MQRAKYSTYDIRVRAVKAVCDGMNINEVAKAYQTHRTTIYRWSIRFKEEGGESGLERKPVSGRPRILLEINDEELLSIILKPASSFDYETDFWTCKRLCNVLEEEFRITVSKVTVLRRLRDLGLTYQKPERKYFELSEEKRREWRNKELPEIRSDVEKYKAILYFQDESHISLTAVLGKTWAPEGKTPIQEVTGKRGGVSAMSAISGTGSLIFQLHEKRIASDEVIHFLEQMLKHHKRRHLRSSYGPSSSTYVKKDTSLYR